MDAATIVGVADDRLETEKISSGGSAETDDTDEAVRATGPCSPYAVMTAMPPGWPRNARLKSSAVTDVPMVGVLSDRSCGREVIPRR